MITATIGSPSTTGTNPSTARPPTTGANPNAAPASVVQAAAAQPRAISRRRGPALAAVATAAILGSLASPAGLLLSVGAGGLASLLGDHPARRRHVAGLQAL